MITVWIPVLGPFSEELKVFSESDGFYIHIKEWSELLILQWLGEG